MSSDCGCIVFSCTFLRAVSFKYDVVGNDRARGRRPGGGPRRRGRIRQDRSLVVGPRGHGLQPWHPPRPAVFGVFNRQAREGGRHLRMVPQPRQGVVPAVTVDAGQRGRGLQSVAVHGAAVIPGAGRVARKIRTSEREAGDGRPSPPVAGQKAPRRRNAAIARGVRRAVGRRVLGMVRVEPAPSSAPGPNRVCRACPNRQSWAWPRLQSIPGTMLAAMA